MKLSARNQFQGTVTKITDGQAMAEVTVKVGTLDFVAAITEGSEHGVKAWRCAIYGYIHFSWENDGEIGKIRQLASPIENRKVTDIL